MRIAWIVTIGVLVAGCGGAPEPRPAEPLDAAARFVDVTARAGIAFVHDAGAEGRKLLPETMGSGCAWLDADGDGRPDLLLIDSGAWPDGTSAPGTAALYRNLGDGTFADATRGSGLDVGIYGMGVAVGDYDNDGDEDVFVSALGPDRLFRNRGDGTFDDVSRAAGVADDGFGASATFLDYDRDGLLDLFVSRYVRWERDNDLFCTLDGTTKSYCTPEPYPGTHALLYRNRGDGTFDDVSAASGIAGHVGKSLGVVVYDHDRDGWPDIAVSNDTVRNFLFRNNGDGTFAEIGERVGLAYSDSGEARAGMGIDAGDIDGSGRESIAVGNFSAESVALFRNLGLERYVDDAGPAGIATPSLLTLAFGTLFLDYDLDGRLDLLVVNGHVEPGVSAVQDNVTYAQPAHLFRNLGGGRFTDTAAGDLVRPMVARGAAYADYDGDGDLDLAVTANQGPARLYRNDAATGVALRVRLVGRDSPRDAFGARVALLAGDERVLWRTVRGGSSYLSQSEPTLTFGVDGAAGPLSLEILWPSGLRQRVEGLEPGSSLVVVEGESEPRYESSAAVTTSTSRPRT